MQQEHDADGGYDEALFQQRPLQRVDGAVDEVRTVVHGHDFDACRQPWGDLGDLGLEVMDDFEGVLSVPRHRDRRNHLSFAIEFGNPAPLVGNELNAGNVADQHRRPLLALDDQRLDVGRPAQVAFAPDHVLGFGHFHDPATHVAVGLADDLRHLGKRYSVRPQLHRIDDDLVGLDEPAHAGDLRDALRLGELIAQIPVLDRAQLGEILVGADKRVLIHPSDPGRVRSELRGNALGKPAGREVQVLEDPRARPIDVRAIFEDHIDE